MLRQTAEVAGAVASAPAARVWTSTPVGVPCTGRRARPVEAPGTWAGENEIQEHEAVQDSGITPVVHRKDATCCVPHEVGERHLARQNERHRAREQTQKNEKTADKLQEPGKSEHREQRRLHVRARWKSQKLLRSVLHENERSHDSQHRQNVWGPAVE